MATTPNFSYALSEESAVHQLINLQLCDSADLFELADTCAACVSVLVETDDPVTFSILCERLLELLKRLVNIAIRNFPRIWLNGSSRGRRSFPACRTAGRRQRCRWIMLWR